MMKEIERLRQHPEETADWILWDMIHDPDRSDPRQVEFTGIYVDQT